MANIQLPWSRRFGIKLLPGAQPFFQRDSPSPPPWRLAPGSLFGKVMSKHVAIISWKRTSPDFLKGKYSREHTWTFDGGLTVPASASPSVVPLPFSNPANVDPEEAFVASISSCHMLTYLYLAGRQGFQVDSYRDEAIGMMQKNEAGVPW